MMTKDVMIGMLRKGLTGDQMLEILNVIAPDKDQVTENVTEAEDAYQITEF